MTLTAVGSDQFEVLHVKRSRCGRFLLVYFVAVRLDDAMELALACGASGPTSLTSWTQAWGQTRRST